MSLFMCNLLKSTCHKYHSDFIKHNILASNCKNSLFSYFEKCLPDCNEIKDNLNTILKIMKLLIVKIIFIPVL